MSQGVRVGDLIHVSGQVAFDDRGEIVGRKDAAAQAEHCFRNLRTVLAAGGATPHDVVMLRCYLTSAAHYPAYAAAKARFLDGVDVPPAGTAVVVAGLLVPGLLMEVEAIAVAGGPAPEG
jgi:2-iminobutanoate/2-iminopropanoate deaminase